MDLARERGAPVSRIPARYVQSRPFRPRGFSPSPPWYSSLCATTPVQLQLERLAPSLTIVQLHHFVALIGGDRAKLRPGWRWRLSDALLSGIWSLWLALADDEPLGTTGLLMAW